jgi:hypothetical protein
MAKSKKDKAEAPPLPQALARVVISPPADPEAEMLCSHLMQIMTPIYSSAGEEVRQGARLSIIARGQCWCVRIDCPTEGYAADVVVRSLTTIAQDIEAAFVANAVNWMPDFQAQKRARQKQKRPL